MKELINNLKYPTNEAIIGYLEKRHKRMQSYSQFEDQYDYFDLQELEEALAQKCNINELTEEELKNLKLDYYYDQLIDKHD